MNKSVYIPSLEASTISSYGERTQLNYDGVLPLSLDLLKIERVARKHGRPFKTYHGITCTDVIIDVRFHKAEYEYDKSSARYYLKQDKYGKHYFASKGDDKVKKNPISQLRTNLYTNEFKINGMTYVEFKRSASKAKSGSHLFIWKNIYEELEDKNLKFEENELTDLTSLKAYQSLESSQIESTLEILPEQILLVDDIKDHLYKTNAAVIRYEGKLSVTYDAEYQTANNIFDGEALMDESLFDKPVGMKLLRAYYFKSAAFNTKIQKFYADEGIDTVYDMFGEPHNATDIKLITTPSSIKFLKFADRFGGKREAYKVWLKTITNQPFGIVKSEHCSPYGNGNYNDLTYQMINSLPLSREDVHQLIDTDREFLNKLANDIDIFRHYIGSRQGATADFINTMLSYSTEFEKTDLYKEFRKEILHGYKEKLYTGAIKVAGDYCTLCSMPYELLRWTLGERPNPLLGKYEVWCSAIQNDIEFVMARNPHITASNYVVATNKYQSEFDEYFNFKNEYGSSNIIIVYPWECDILERLGGADFDSDVALCIKNPLILKRAKQVQYLPVPHSEIKPSGNSLKPYNALSLVEVDSQLSKNKIGEIVNLSQILNSYYWQEYFKTNHNNDYLDMVYKNILALSVLSTIEIDKAKHPFDLPMERILHDIRNLEYDGELVIQKDKKSGLVYPKTETLQRMIEHQRNGEYQKAQELLEIKEYERQEM